MTRKLFEIASDIIQAQASLGQMAPDDVQSALMKTFTTLQKMKRAEEEGLDLGEGKPAEETLAEEKASERMNPQDSIQNDKIICLECGAEFRQLTARHLASHGMSPRDYKKNYGFTLRTPLSAKSLTKARSKAAKKRGLPENLVKYREDKKQRKAEEALSQAAPGDMLSQGVPPLKEAISEEPKEVKVPAKRGRKKKAA